MKSKIFTFLFVGVFLLFSGCSEENALVPNLDKGSLKSVVKPAANLNGEMSIVTNPSAATPNDPVWIGTIDLEGYDDLFGIRFFHIDDNGMNPPKAYLFEEWWEIYTLPNGPIVLAGPDSGVMSWPNGKFRMNGEVSTAKAPIEEGWMGRNVHIQGMMWPIGNNQFEATGTFRVN